MEAVGSRTKRSYSNQQSTVGGSGLVSSVYPPDSTIFLSLSPLSTRNPSSPRVIHHWSGKDPVI